MATSFCAVEFVRGYHAYLDIWSPEEGERCIREYSK